MVEDCKRRLEEFSVVSLGSHNCGQVVGQSYSGSSSPPLEMDSVLAVLYFWPSPPSPTLTPTCHRAGVKLKWITSEALSLVPCRCSVSVVFLVSSSWEAVGPLDKASLWEAEKPFLECLADLHCQCPWMRNDKSNIHQHLRKYIAVWGNKGIRFFRSLRIITGNSDRPGRQQLISLETSYMHRRHRKAGHASTPPVFPKLLWTSGISTIVFMSPDSDKMYNDSVLRLSLTEVDWVNVDKIPTKYFLKLI